MAEWADYRVSLWNRYGEFLRYIRVTWNCVWVINDIGTAEFSIGIDDPSCRKEFLRIGNYVLFEHARLGDWAGVIAPNNGQDWSGEKVVTIRALEAMYQFHRRKGPLYTIDAIKLDDTFVLIGTPGKLIRMVINYANVERDTLLRPGAVIKGKDADLVYPSDRVKSGGIWDGGDEIMIRLKDAMCHELVAEILKRSKTEIWITPGRDDNGQLAFYVNLMPRQGVEQGYTLREGVNLQMEGGSMYREDGELCNKMTVIANLGGTYARAEMTNDASIEEYDLWEGSEEISDSDPTKYAQVYVNKHGRLRRTFKLTAIETPESPATFSHVWLGDTVRLVAYSIAFYHNQVGVDKDIRIVGLEYNTEVNRAILVTDDNKGGAI